MRITRYIISIITAVSLITASAYSTDDFLSSRVKDISDRKYEGAVIELLDNAKESIVISMYTINLGTTSNNPVKLLLNDLFEARERGVSVTIYLNTRLWVAGTAKKYYVKNSTLKELEEAGCVIHLMDFKRMLHDKLVIVDKRYVVEGSVNWSTSALKSNRESATLIDSPELAKIKLTRLKTLIMPPAYLEEEAYTPAYIENLPKTLKIPKELILNNKYFHRMAAKHSNFTMELYCILLAHSQTTKKKEFFLCLEDMALSLRMPVSLTSSALRKEVINGLKELQNDYHLIKVTFFHGKDAAITLTDIPGKTLIMPTDSLIQLKDAELSTRLRFLLLIEALLKDQGEDIHSMTYVEIGKRFDLHRITISSAFKDLEKFRE